VRGACSRASSTPQRRPFVGIDGSVKRTSRLVLGLALAFALVGVAAVVLRGRLKHAVEATARLVAPQQWRSSRPLDVAAEIYTGKLSNGWSDWGWGPHRLGSGPAQVVFEGYGGILLHHAVQSTQYGAFSFRYLAPADWGEFMHVSLRGSAANAKGFPKVDVERRHVAMLEGGWREVLIDWEELNPRGVAFDGILIGGRRQVKSDWVLLDQVVLTKPPATVVIRREDSLHVQCRGRSHPIDPLIYGNSSEAWASGQSAQRLGGNPLSRFNWPLGAWNTGSDWFFENVKVEHSLFEMIDSRAKAKRVSALVVPILGWVAKDGSSFGFPRSVFGPQRKHDRYKSEAGDGFGTDGKPLLPGAPEQTSLPAPPELIEQWVRRLVAEGEQRGSRGVQIYILDNEPSLWNVTHRDVHPEPVSYDELLDRSTRYAQAIRRADPAAVIAGPAEWGWLAYQYSAVDRAAGGSAHPDRSAHGDVALVPWYLQKMAELEAANGVRLLDMLDLHFYPAADGVFGSNAATDASTSALRLRSTRSLWDPTYRDESWINDTIRLIPRMKEWVRQNYPGLKLSIGEWNFGAEDHISGGLATAEALGRFGQQGLDAAFFWGTLKEGTPSYWAFRAFRNFDDAGGRFLDLSLPVVEGQDVSLFASRDQQANHFVVVLINRSASARTETRVEFLGCRPISSARFFTYAGQALKPTVAAIAGTSVSVSLEPYSISVLDVSVDSTGN